VRPLKLRQYVLTVGGQGSVISIIGVASVYG